MKSILLTAGLVLFTVIAFSQNNMISLSGGYAFANVDASDVTETDPNVKGSGWRINGVYDFYRNGSSVAYGIAVGYINVTATYDEGSEPLDYKISTVPIYFAPKYLFGSERVKGFIKAVIGCHSSNYERKSSSATVTGKDFGFYGGGGAGLMVFVSDMIFLQAEYEIAYMTNDYFRNGLMQTAMAGIGLKF